MKKLLFIGVFFFKLSVQLFAQCAFDPTVSGDTLLCPNTTGLLTTQVYDSYQWYKRPLFGGPSVPVPGAISQTLVVDAGNDAGFYFKVEATLDTCTEFSPEVLVDGWLFLPPYTIIEGDYTIGGNGELILCQGDTIFLISGSPYVTNVQWYDGGTPIAGANDDTLIVTVAGSYTFSGAPDICPNYVQTQFISSDVTVINCTIGLPEMKGDEIGIFPNPATDRVAIIYPGCEKVEITDMSGKVVIQTFTENKNSRYNLDISDLPAGTYTIIVSGKGFTKGATLLKK